MRFVVAGSDARRPQNAGSRRTWDESLHYDTLFRRDQGLVGAIQRSSRTSIRRSIRESTRRIVQDSPRHSARILTVHSHRRFPRWITERSMLLIDVREERSGRTLGRPAYAAYTVYQQESRRPSEGSDEEDRAQGLKHSSCMNLNESMLSGHYE